MNLGVLGSNMGAAAAYHMMCSEGVQNVYLADYDEAALGAASEKINNALAKTKRGTGATLHTRVVNADDPQQVRAFMEQCDSVLGAIAYGYNFKLSQIAVETKTNYVDLGGNNDIVAQQRTLDDAAREAGINILYDCGLAPGQPSLVARDALARLDSVDELKFYCGGLPRNPSGPLNYAIAFSVNGLINEYIEIATGVINGQEVQLEPMGDLQHLLFDGNPEFDKLDDMFRQLEAFNTSGGTSTLPETYADKIKTIMYQTLRLPGHIKQIRTLNDAGLLSYGPQKLVKSEGGSVRPRDAIDAFVNYDGNSGLTEVLENLGMLRDDLLIQVKDVDKPIGPRDFVEAFLNQTLPHGDDDVIIVHAEAAGKENGKDQVLEYTVVDLNDETTGFTSMQRMTAFPASIIAQMAAAGKITHHGAVPPELCVDTDHLYEELRRDGIDFTPQKRWP